MPTKRCFAEGCTERIPTNLLMCRDHWNKVPQRLQQDVYGALDAWLKRRESPKAYIDAIKAARAAVAIKGAK